MATATEYRPLVMDLTQNSPDWLVWRQNGIGSSDAAAIMGVSPWQTPLRLFELKTGRVESPPPTAAMRRGTDLEAQARREFEFEYDTDFRPACLIHPEHAFLKASLDGWSRDGSVVLEIKAPGQKAHAEAVAGRVPAYYVPQVQHLLMVSGARECHYWSWTPEDGGVLVRVERDEAYIATLLAAEVGFWRCVQEDEPPATSEADVVERTDEEWEQAAMEFRRLYADMAEAEAYLKHARERLIALANGQRCEGAGVKVTPYTADGRVNWQRFHKDVEDVTGERWDTTKYRGAAISSVRVSVEGE